MPVFLWVSYNRFGVVVVSLQRSWDWMGRVRVAYFIPSRRCFRYRSNGRRAGGHRGRLRGISRGRSRWGGRCARGSGSQKLGYRATCDVRRATCDVRRATCDVRRATCGVRRATCDVRRAACGVRRAACGVRRAVKIVLLNSSMVGVIEDTGESLPWSRFSLVSLLKAVLHCVEQTV